MIRLFKRKPKGSIRPLFWSKTLCTVKINSVEDWKVFADYCHKNRIYRNYALTNGNEWLRDEPVIDCFAIIRYCPNAGAGHLVRCDIFRWNPYTAIGLGNYFNEAHSNYMTVKDFTVLYSSDMIYWLLYEKFGKL